MAQPIWKDYFVTLGTAASYNWTISLYDTAETIYTGTAVKAPGESNVVVRINDICADYLRNTLPSLAASGFSTATPYKRSFVIGANSTVVATVEFVYDWSYDYDANYSNDHTMSAPITGICDYRMPVIHTCVGSTISVEDVMPVADFNLDYNIDFDTENAVTQSLSGTGNYVRLVNNWQYHNLTIESGSFEHTEYYVRKTCQRWGLYYVNAYGGWDSFVPLGHQVQSDGYTRTSFKQTYDNRDSRNRGTVEFSNQIARTMTLQSGWLTDEQAGRMHHFLGSTNVYLYNMETAKVYPAVIRTSSCQYKTFASEGHRMVNYAIELEVAHDMQRR